MTQINADERGEEENHGNISARQRGQRAICEYKREKLGRAFNEGGRLWDVWAEIKPEEFEGSVS